MHFGNVSNARSAHKHAASTPRVFSKGPGHTWFPFTRPWHMRVACRATRSCRIHSSLPFLYSPTRYIILCSIPLFTHYRLCYSFSFPCFQSQTSIAISCLSGRKWKIRQPANGDKSLFSSHSSLSTRHRARPEQGAQVHHPRSNEDFGLSHLHMDDSTCRTAFPPFLL